ncbi:unnamed protein product [Acanthosepion pharaonis]|uniref:Uncharacterized protein n=1 Tax=Acanthosepion pharaonis TaxID=158019 RepID=A0A812EZ31_ACAPH|nr:unnamed protein product [Sepia pharaonis]
MPHLSYCLKMKKSDVSLLRLVNFNYCGVFTFLFLNLTQQWPLSFFSYNFLSFSHAAIFFHFPFLSIFLLSLSLKHASFYFSFSVMFFFWGGGFTSTHLFLFLSFNPPSHSLCCSLKHFFSLFIILTLPHFLLYKLSFSPLIHIPLLFLSFTLSLYPSVTPFLLLSFFIFFSFLIHPTFYLFLFLLFSLSRFLFLSFFFLHTHILIFIFRVILFTRAYHSKSK